MKSALLASVSIVALSVASGASAADLPLKARPMPVAAAPIYSWTGCYVGAHVGWGQGRHNHTHNGLINSFSGGGTSVAAGGRVDSSGGLFGGQVGCNYQFASNWVIGIQGDVAGTDFNGKVQDAFGATIGGDPDTRNIVGVKTDWLSSVTGRLGYTFYNNQGMLYAKGGGAWVHNVWDLHDTWLDYGAATASETRAGWTVGGGIEWKFTQNWSGFVEYNFYSFGGDKVLAVDPDATFRTFTSNKQEISTVKIGVNYSFTQGPIVARY